MTAERFRERRRHRRVPVRMVLETEVGPDQRKVRMETLNMSAGGFSCRMDRPLEPLTVLRIGLSFPPFGTTTREPRQVQCSGVVVRCEPWRRDGGGGYEVAVCFTWITPRDRKLLSDYLAWYETVYLGSDEEGLARRAG